MHEITDARNKNLTIREPVTLKTKEDGKVDSLVPDLISTCLAIRNGVDLENPATLFNALSQYLNACAMSGGKISTSMLCFACGVHRSTLNDWFHGARHKNNPEYKRFATLVRDICSAAREQYGLEGTVNPILTIFHQKYYDGFSDTPQVDEVEDPLGENQDPAKLAEKYKDIIVD